MAASTTRKSVTKKKSVAAPRKSRASTAASRKKVKKSSDDSDAASGNDDDNGDEEEEVAYVATIDEQENPLLHKYATAILTGGLGQFPAELLLNVIILLDPKAVVNFLATCRALRGLSQGGNAQYLYRSLYHALISRVSAFGSHTIFSPVAPGKGRDVTTTPIRDLLGLTEIRSWREQYFGAAFWYLQHIYQSMKPPVVVRNVCTLCRATQCLIISDERFKLRLCLECYSSNLTVKSNIRQYGLTVNDIKHLPVETIRTVGGLGAMVDQGFYSSSHLTCLAKAKNPSFTEPKSIIKDNRAERLTIVECATFLMGAVPFTTSIPSIKDEAGNVIHMGNFDRELYNYVENITPRQPRQRRNYAVEKVKAPRTKKRSIADIIEDYAEMVDKYSHLFPPNEDGTPMFILPANYADLPAFPSNNTLEAWKAMKDRLDELDLSINGGGLRRQYSQYASEISRITLDTVGLIQSYLVDPTDELLESVLDAVFLDNEACIPTRRTLGQVGATAPIDNVPNTNPTLQEIVEIVETPGQPPNSQAYIAAHQIPSFIRVRTEIPAGETDPEVIMEARREADDANSLLMAEARATRDAAVVIAVAAKPAEDAEWVRTKRIELTLNDAEKDMVQTIDLMSRAAGNPLGAYGWRVESNAFTRVEKSLRKAEARKRALMSIYEQTSEQRKRVLNDHFTHSYSWGFNQPLITLSKLYHLGNQALAHNLLDRKRVSMTDTHNEVKRIAEKLQKQLISPSAASSVLQQTPACPYNKQTSTVYANSKLCTDGLCWIPGKNKPHSYRYY